MSREPVILESRIATSWRLRVQFAWRGDRFGHTIELAHGGQVVPLLVSIEGPFAGGSPLSPPLQQLALEDRARGLRVALLVGMAGGDHWSLSVDAAPHGALLMFDVACRAQRPDAVLGSRYQDLSPPTGPDGELVESPGRNPRIAWQVRVSPSGNGPPRSGASATLIKGDGIWTIVPLPSSRPTVRWQYCVELSEANSWTDRPAESWV